MSELSGFANVIGQVWAMITGEPLLVWALLILTVAVFATVIGRTLGKAVRWAFGIFSGALGTFLITHIITSLS